MTTDTATHDAYQDLRAKVAEWRSRGLTVRTDTRQAADFVECAVIVEPSDHLSDADELFIYRNMEDLYALLEDEASV